MSDKVPTLGDVAGVLDRFPAPDWATAALHLLTPVTVVVGIEAYRVGSGWSYRGFHTDDLSLRGLRGLVLAGVEKEDAFLNLEDAALADLVKVTRSGAGHVVTGLSALAGLPDLYAGLNVPREVVDLVVEQLSYGDRGPVGTFVVDGNLYQVISRLGRLWLNLEAEPVAWDKLTDRAGALEAAKAAARIRQMWGVGSTRLERVDSVSSLAQEYLLTCEKDPSIVARLSIARGLCQQIPAG